MLKIENKPIGDGHPVFIVFEAGATHDGLHSAKQLAKYSKEAGADAIKFQMVDPDRLCPDKSQMFEYKTYYSVDNEIVSTMTKSESLHKILMRRVLTKEEWIQLKHFCDSIDLIFFSTATFQDEVDLLLNLNVDTIKICSGDINHLPFIRDCAKTGKVIQIDTGNASIREIRDAFWAINSESNERIIIHNCPSGYPAKIESINLKTLNTLKELFLCPVAFSDHTPGIIMSIAAVAAGANMIEKTITLDKTIQGPEHMFSLEFEEMQIFVQSIRDVEIAMGKRIKIVSKEEREKGNGARRSPVLNCDVKKGDIIKLSMVDFVRPGKELEPDTVMTMQGKRFAKDLSKGHNLYYGDWE